MSIRSPSLVSLFSGAGGLDVGLEQAGFKSLLATDFDGPSCETLRLNSFLTSLTSRQFHSWAYSHVKAQRCHKALSDADFSKFIRRVECTVGQRKIAGPELVVQRDVRKLFAEEILDATRLQVGELDLLAGGPPCQPFSRAGKRQMMGVSDGLLFLEFVRLVQDLKPRYFLFENVKGMVVQKSFVKKVTCLHCGATEIPEFTKIEQLESGDQLNCLCAVCRHDKMTVSSFNTRGGALEIVENEFEKLGYTLHTKVLNAADFGAPQSRERVIIIGSRDAEPFHFPTGQFVDPKLTGPQGSLFDQERRPWKTMADTIYSRPHYRYGNLDLEKAKLWVKNVVRPHAEPVTWGLDRIAPTVGAHQSAKLAIAPLGVPKEQIMRQQWHTLGRRQGDSPPVFVEHEYLSDLELLELQTFPTDWYLHGTRMQRAFQIGNAVPPVLAKALGESILQCLDT